MKPSFIDCWRRPSRAPGNPESETSPAGHARGRLWRLAWMAPVFAVLFGFASITNVRASDPVGIYGWVEKVVPEPAEGQPDRVQVWGAFAIAEKSGYTYRPAQTGYLYLTVNPENPTASRREWSDLQSVAGTRQVVAFASRRGPKASVRSKDERPAKPDPHPLGFGLTRVVNRDYAPVRELLAIADQRNARPVPGSPGSPAKEEPSAGGPLRPDGRGGETTMIRMAAIRWPAAISP